MDLKWNDVMQTLKGHSDWVCSVAFSHDSRLLASGSFDWTVRIWDAATGTLQQTLEGHSNGVCSAAFSHDSRLLASGSYDKTVRIWDAATGTLQQTLEGHSCGVNLVAFSHDSRLLASGSDDWTVRIWDAATGTLQQTLEGHSDGVNLVAFSHDSRLLASWSADKTVRIWDAATGTLQQTIVGDFVSTLSFDVTNSILITDIGCFKVNGTQISSLSISSQEGDNTNSCEGLGLNRAWVTWKAQNILCLPTAFWATASAISLTDSILAIGCSSGKVFTIGVSPDILNSYYS
jgi:WD40 repeat protein